LQKIKEAFIKEYMAPGGRLVSGTQTAYVFSLNFDMLPDVLRKQVAARLTENVRSYDNHLTTGFLGTPTYVRFLHAMVMIVLPTSCYYNKLILPGYTR
jgi:hypothetical protein